MHHTSVNKMKRKILRSFDYQFYVSHSRYTTFLKKNIGKVDELDTLTESNETGVYIISSKHSSRFIVTGYPEYDPDTLDKEFRQDLLKLDINSVMPQNYYKNNAINDEIEVKWKSYAYLVF